MRAPRWPNAWRRCTGTARRSGRSARKSAADTDRYSGCLLRPGYRGEREEELAGAEGQHPRAGGRPDTGQRARRSPPGPPPTCRALRSSVSTNGTPPLLLHLRGEHRLFRLTRFIPANAGPMLDPYPVSRGTPPLAWGVESCRADGLPSRATSTCVETPSPGEDDYEDTHSDQHLSRIFLEPGFDFRLFVMSPERGLE